MNNTVSNNKRRIIEQAAAWHARLAADDVTSQDWRDLEAWLEQDSAHRDTFESLDRLSGALRSLGDAPVLQALHDSVPNIASVSEAAEIVPLRPGKVRRRIWGLAPRQMALAASVLVALLVPLLYFMGSQEAPEATNHETAVGERQAIELEDGSSITLNADSSLTVMFAKDERNVTLWRGDLFVEVAEQPDRPFVVKVGDHRVVVSGTSFDIRYRDDPARVTVHEGRVLVTRALDETGFDDAVELKSGQQLILEPGSVPTDLSQDELSSLSGWRNGWLHFEDQSLAAVVKELDPYLDKRIVLTSRKVEELKVGGSFNVDEVDSMLTAMETLLPIEVVRESDRIVIRHDADSTSP